MIKYQRISGVKLGESTQSVKVITTPEGRAMGAIPGWSVFVDPAYASPDYARNRAVSSSTPYFSGAIAFSEIEGEPAFNFSNEQPGRLQAPIGGEINKDRWSVFFVTAGASGEGSSSSPRQEIVSPSDSEVEGLCLRIVIASPPSWPVSIYEGAGRDDGQPRRLDYLGTELGGETPALIICTFSIEHGLAIWRDGEKVAEDSSDRRPLTAATGPGDYEMFRYRRGKQGMAGILNIDLSAPENTGHRRAIEKFLMSKYDIPEGPQ